MKEVIRIHASFVPGFQHQSEDELGFHVTITSVDSIDEKDRVTTFNAHALLLA